MYKCTDDKGSISYQATPCKNSDNGKEIKKMSKNAPNKTQCKSTCDSKHLICVSKLENGTWNSDGGLDVCKKETEVCNIGCTDPRKAKLLKAGAKYERSIYEIDKKYKKKKEVRIAKRDREKLQKCSKAKLDHKKAQKAWDDATFSYSRRKNLTESDRELYLNKIDRAERNIKYDCN